MTKGFRLCAWLALACGVALAVDWKALQPQGYVSDFSGVVDSASRAQLERYGAAVEQATGAQMALVAIPTLHGEPVEDVANTLFRAWGVGRKGTNQGILLLLVTGDRRTRLEVGYGLEPIIPDGFAGSILREMRPALGQQQYGEAFLAAAETMGNRIAQAKGVAIPAHLERRIPRGTGGVSPWAAVVPLGGALLVLVLLFNIASRGGRGGGGGLLAGMLLGGMMNRGSWGGRGSGGFGGFDSGDGFGGFGGGDSGGGGASSDW